MATIGYAAGFEKALIWLTYNGYAAGTLGDTIANGNSTAAYVVSDVETAGLQYQDPNNLAIQGGDRIVATFLFGNPKLNPFDLQISVTDPTLIAMLSGSVVDETTNSSFELFSSNTYKARPINIGVALSQRFQPKATGSDGNDKYHTLIIPRASAVVKMGQFGFQAGSPVMVSITPSTTDRMHNGILFSATTMALEENRADSYSMITDYPIHILTAMGATTTGTVALTTTYRPISSVITTGAAPNWLAVNGISNTLTSVNTTTGGVVIPVSPDHIAPGEIGVLTYQTIYRSI